MGLSTATSAIEHPTNYRHTIFTKIFKKEFTYRKMSMEHILKRLGHEIELKKFDKHDSSRLKNETRRHGFYKFVKDSYNLMWKNGNSLRLCKSYVDSIAFFCSHIWTHVKFNYPIISWLACPRAGVLLLLIPRSVGLVNSQRYRRRMCTFVQPKRGKGPLHWPIRCGINMTKYMPIT